MRTVDNEKAYDAYRKFHDVSKKLLEADAYNLEDLFKYYKIPDEDGKQLIEKSLFGKEESKHRKERVGRDEWMAEELYDDYDKYRGELSEHPEYKEEIIAKKFGNKIRDFDKINVERIKKELWEFQGGRYLNEALIDDISMLLDKSQGKKLDIVRGAVLDNDRMIETPQKERNHNNGDEIEQ